MYISLDNQHDAEQQFMLTALQAASSNRFLFVGPEPSDAQSLSVEQQRVRRRRQIQSATHTLVVIGDHANRLHPDAVAIGERNWQWWEIAYSIERRKKIVAARIKSTVESPPQLRGLGVAWAYSFNVVTILQAIERA